MTSVVERGAVFRELDYMNALQLLHRSQPHPDPAKYFAKIHTALNYSFPFQVDCKHGEVERGSGKTWSCSVKTLSDEIFGGKKRERRAVLTSPALLVIAH